MIPNRLEQVVRWTLSFLKKIYWSHTKGLSAFIEWIKNVGTRCWNSILCLPIVRFPRRFPHQYVVPILRLSQPEFHSPNSTSCCYWMLYWRASIVNSLRLSCITIFVMSTFLINNPRGNVTRSVNNVRTQVTVSAVSHPVSHRVTHITRSVSSSSVHPHVRVSDEFSYIWSGWAQANLEFNCLKIFMLRNP
jgi:hypothetical protein